MTRAMVLTSVLLLAACVQGTGPRDVGPPVPSTGVDACGAAELQDMVGQPRRILQTMKFAVPVRMIEPGQAVTQDYSPNRLNIYINADRTIASISCG